MTSSDWARTDPLLHRWSFTELADTEQQLRSDLAEAMQTMRRLRLNVGTSGNASARFGDGLLITPSGVVPEQLTPERIAFVSAQGPPRTDESGSRPSSEWRLHQAVLAARPDAAAVVHCHSRFATVLACAGRTIPAVHYLVGLSGCTEVPITPYARFGSEQLADYTASALEGANACLLANHGLVVCAGSVADAVALAEDIEELAAIHWHTLAIGGGTVIEQSEMHAVLAALDTYRRPTD